MYDPVLARFLAVDPIIKAPDYSQSFNSYSYCFNNPLKFLDPSGLNAKNKQGNAIADLVLSLVL
jgi:hypothetical protein